MTDFEIISTFLGILGLLIEFYATVKGKNNRRDIMHYFGEIDFLLKS